MKNPKIFSSSGVVLFIILLDQITKAIAIKFLPTECNAAFAFGIFRGALNGLVASLFLTAVIWAFLRERKKITYFALSLVIGGGASNILDRLMRGCVVDFIDLGVWPAFNIADAAVSVGAGILLLSLFRGFGKR